MEFDSRKNAFNVAKHGISFEEITRLEWDSAVTKRDTRYDYGEVRNISYVYYRERLHVLVWTEREGQMRSISLRKANSREVKRYEKEKNAKS